MSGFLPKIFDPPPPRVSLIAQTPQTNNPHKVSPRDSSGVFSQLWSGWFRHISQTLNDNQAALSGGLSATITTAKLTGGGANGSMTFTNGILTSHTQAT